MMPWRMRLALAFVAFFALTACFVVVPIPATGGGCRGEASRSFPAAEVVQVMAQSDLSCPAEQVRVQPSAAGAYRASGCGKSRAYTCEEDEIAGCSVADAAERDGCEAVSP